MRGLLADALELPAAAIGDEDRLLSDLHLNSLRVAQLVGNAATACGRAIPAEPLSLSDVSVGDLVVMVDALPPSTAEHDETLVPPGVADWHRILVPETRPMEPAATGRRYAWRVFGSGPLREAVAALLSQPSRPDNRPVPSAVLVFLPEDPDDADIDVLLEAAHDAVRHRRLLAVVDHGDTASGFLGTIRQEHPELEVHWIRTMAPHRPEGVTRALRALPDLPPEIVVDERGRSCTVAHAPPPRAAAQKSAQKSAGTSVAAAPRHALGPDDVVLVTGGGKGIGFETALALGRRTGARVALLGRSRQDADSELRANLARLRDSGLAFAYETADVTDAAEVNGALRAITRSLGSVTALVHASGINRPGRFDDLDREAYAEHAAPKVHGLSTVIGALDAAALRVVVTYGSVIGRFGLTGEAHYALANGRLRERTRLLARDLPGCWVCNVDWTAWAEAGMGERLDVIDRLVRAGVVPVPVGRGVELLMELLDTRPGTGTVLATGRLPGLGDPPTPAGHRFIERIHTLVPGVELVAEAELGERDDRYLADHQIDGIPVLPAVCMLEAMAQAAHVLTRRSAAGIEDARFHRPISVPPGGSRTMRICALVRNDGDVDVVLRSDENGYTADHCGGRVVWDGADPPEVPARRSPLPKHDGSGLYGPLFFHGPVFRRLRRYEHLEATGCTAVLASGPPQLGESPLVLGDVARNDATIHVLQACVPHRRLLPVDCGAFRLHTPAAMDGDGGCGDLVVAAVERSHIAADYTYDVVVRDAAGRAVLSWVGLRLRDVGPLSAATGRSAVLLGPYLQRAITALLPRSSLQAQITTMPPGAERTDR
ncbi:MAG TPA: SDR family NAD(P)-dependent oxidoreductase, partial [Streptosporangiaceae bacterium]|nr:SDR family NAD(P)-dependent oxidoreductase [Streptosporangiaceae bacterium]